MVDPPVNCPKPPVVTLEINRIQSPFDLVNGVIAHFYKTKDNKLFSEHVEGAELFVLTDVQDDNSLNGHDRTPADPNSALSENFIDVTPNISSSTQYNCSINYRLQSAEESPFKIYVDPEHLNYPKITEETSVTSVTPIQEFTEPQIKKILAENEGTELSLAVSVTDTKLVDQIPEQISSTPSPEVGDEVEPPCMEAMLPPVTCAEKLVSETLPKTVHKIFPTCVVLKKFKGRHPFTKVPFPEFFLYCAQCCKVEKAGITTHSCDQPSPPWVEDEKKKIDEVGPSIREEASFVADLASKNNAATASTVLSPDALSSMSDKECAHSTDMHNEIQPEESLEVDQISETVAPIKIIMNSTDAVSIDGKKYQEVDTDCNIDNIIDVITHSEDGALETNEECPEIEAEQDIGKLNDTAEIEESERTLNSKSSKNTSTLDADECPKTEADQINEMCSVKIVFKESDATLGNDNFESPRAIATAEARCDLENNNEVDLISRVSVKADGNAEICASSKMILCPKDTTPDAVLSPDVEADGNKKRDEIDLTSGAEECAETNERLKIDSSSSMITTSTKDTTVSEVEGCHDIEAGKQQEEVDSTTGVNESTDANSVSKIDLLSKIALSPKHTPTEVDCDPGIEDVEELEVNSSKVDPITSDETLSEAETSEMDNSSVIIQRNRACRSPKKCSTCLKVFRYDRNFEKHVVYCNNSFEKKPRTISSSDSSTQGQRISLRKRRRPRKHLFDVGVQPRNLKVKLLKRAGRTRQEFECDRCREIFSSKMDLKKHIKRHTSKEEMFAPFQTYDGECKLCRKPLAETQIFGHLVRKHSKVAQCLARKTCNQNGCLKKFSTEALFEHRRSFHNEAVLHCPICASEFRSHFQLISHASEAHGLDPLESFSKYDDCDQCSYRGADAFTEHMRIKHKRFFMFSLNHCKKEVAVCPEVNNQPLSSCGQCNEAFLCLGDIDYHKYEHNSTFRPSLYDKCTLNCPLCKEEFESRRIAIAHVIAKHTNWLSSPLAQSPDIETFVCRWEDCQFHTRHLQPLFAHRRSKHGENLHDCIICGALLHTIWDLVDHYALDHQIPQVKSFAPDKLTQKCVVIIERHKLAEGSALKLKRMNECSEASEQPPKRKRGRPPRRLNKAKIPPPPRVVTPPPPRNEPPLLSCDLCNLKARRKQILKKHIASKHCLHPMSMDCKIFCVGCRSTMSQTEFKVKRHLNACYANSSECPLCSKQCNSVEHILRHLNWGRKLNPRPCSFCADSDKNENYYNDINLSQHALEEHF